MKKLIAMLLAIVMVLSFATVAFADEPTASYTQDGKTYTDVGTVTIKKIYKLTNVGTTSPKETFSFSALTCTEVTNAADGVTKDNAPIPTISDVTFEQGKATTGGAEGTATITLPALGSLTSDQDEDGRYAAYPSVGEYTYTFNEVNNGVAGVTYYGETMKLVVTVVQDGDNGKLRVAGVHCEAAVAEGETKNEKTDTFENTYSAGKLEVSKTVTGNLGDRDNYFDVDVTFTSTKPVNAAITVKGGSKYNDEESYTIPAYDKDSIETTNVWKYDAETKIYTATTTIQVKHGDTVTFENIPYDVVYKVKEKDYSREGYKTSYSFNTSNIVFPESGVISGDVPEFKVNAETHTYGITNNKETTVDTGITLDSVPYIVMLAVAACGMVVFMTKKRHED